MTALLNLNDKKGLIVGIANEHSIAYTDLPEEHPSLCRHYKHQLCRSLKS